MVAEMGQHLSERLPPGSVAPFGEVTARLAGPDPADADVLDPVRADAQPAVGTAENAPRGAGSSAKASTARLTAIIPAWSAMKRTKVACAISDQMILTGSCRTPQP